MRILSCIFLLVTAYAASAQIGIGTVVIVNFTKDKLIMAADSRASYPNGDQPPDDGHCKISAFGHKVVFATTGAAFRFPSHPTDLAWSNSEIALAAFRSTNHAGNSLSEIADEWGKIVRGNWVELYRRNPSAVSQIADPNNGIITAGFFADVEHGEFVTAAVVLTFSSSRSPVLQAQRGTLSDCTIISATRLCAMGATAVFDGFVTGESPWKGDENVTTSKDSAIDLETMRAIRLVDLTAIHEKKNTVGGPIDALEIWKDGSIHWVARKKNCPENQN